MLAVKMRTFEPAYIAKRWLHRVKSGQAVRGPAENVCVKADCEHAGNRKPLGCRSSKSRGPEETDYRGLWSSMPARPRERAYRREVITICRGESKAFTEIIVI